MNKAVAIAALVLLSGCSAMDMQGKDPKDYFAKNPTKNQVVREKVSVPVGFVGSKAELPSRDLKSLNEKLAPVNRQAVDAVSVEAATNVNTAQRKYLSDLLRHMGIRNPITFDVHEGLAAGEAVITVEHAALKLPDCPNWKASPVTSYSNTASTNFGCANTVNLGLMLEDPRDLERGASAGRTSPNIDRASDAVRNNRESLKEGPAPALTPSSSAPIAGQ